MSGSATPPQMGREAFADWARRTDRPQAMPFADCARLVGRHMARTLGCLEADGCDRRHIATVRAGMAWLRADLTDAGQVGAANSRRGGPAVPQVPKAERHGSGASGSESP